MRAKIIIAILITCFGSSAMAYIVDGARISRPRMLSYANKLKNQGTIEQTGSGLTYLKVPESYIQELFKQIQTPGYEVQRKPKISIINEQEAKKISKLKELGRTVEFKPLGFYTIMEDNLEYFILAVDAPELSSLRSKYGLADKLEDHAFTLTIAVREVKAHDELGNQKSK